MGCNCVAGTLLAYSLLVVLLLFLILQFHRLQKFVERMTVVPLLPSHIAYDPEPSQSPARP